MSQLEKTRAAKKHEGDGTTTGLGLWVRGHRLNAHTRERDKAEVNTVKTITKAGKGTEARRPQEELTFRNKQTDTNDEKQKEET